MLLNFGNKRGGRIKSRTYMQNIDAIKKDVMDSVSGLYGNHLKKIILFGSYARNDSNEESDIDFLVITDNVKENNFKLIDNQLTELAARLSIKHGPIISLMETNDKHFDRWKMSLPLFVNISKEGKTLYA